MPDAINTVSLTAIKTPQVRTPLLTAALQALGSPIFYHQGKP